MAIATMIAPIILGIRCLINMRCVDAPRILAEMCIRDRYIDAGELKRYLDQDVYGDEGANRQETELLEQFLSENSGRLDRILPVLSVIKQKMCIRDRVKSLYFSPPLWKNSR